MSLAKNFSGDLSYSAQGGNLATRRWLWMARNIEVKARIDDFPGLKSAVESLSDVPGILLRQQDTFFFVPGGRLKLRESRPGDAELIYYQRADGAEAKLSEYSRATVDDPTSLGIVLSTALGARGRVRKERLLYQSGQTRIHLDRVEQLGDFLELEYVLREGEQEAVGRKTVASLLCRFGIREEDLIAGSYIDLMKREA